jgi:PKD repeat protein
MKHARSLLLFLCVTAAPLFAEINFTSEATATPSPAVAGQVVTFSEAAVSSLGLPLTYTWNFGDGTNASGATATHTYTTAGIYNANSIVSDTQGNQLESIIEVEVILPSSTPLTMTFTKGSGKIYLKETGKDSLSFSGTIANVPAGNNPAGQTVTVNIAGVINTFTVKSSGSGKSAGGSTISFKVSKKFSGSNVPFQVKLIKQTLLTQFEAGGFNLQTGSASNGLVVDISWGSPTGGVSARATVSETLVDCGQSIFYAIRATLVFLELILSP